MVIKRPFVYFEFFTKPEIFKNSELFEIPDFNSIHPTKFLINAEDYQVIVRINENNLDDWEVCVRGEKVKDSDIYRRW